MWPINIKSSVKLHVARGSHKAGNTSFTAFLSMNCAKKIGYSTCVMGMHVYILYIACTVGVL